MKINYAGPGQELLCESCGQVIEDAFATENPDAEDHFCDRCVDFVEGLVSDI